MPDRAIGPADEVRADATTIHRGPAAEPTDRAAIERAEQRLRELLAADASNVRIHEALAVLALRRAEMDGPRAWLLAAFVIAGGRAVAQRTGGPTAGLDNAAGLLAVAQDDQIAARRAFLSALASDPGHRAAALNLGVLAAHQRDWKTARKMLERGLGDRNLSREIDASLALAVTLRRLGEREAARARLHAIATEHDDVRAWFLLGDLAEERAHDVGGIARFHQARLYFDRARRRSGASERPELVEAATDRIAAIDALLAPPPPREDLEAEWRELEKYFRLAEIEEKQRLRALEREWLREEGAVIEWGASSE